MWGRFFCQLYSSYTPDIFWRGFLEVIMSATSVFLSFSAQADFPVGFMLLAFFTVVLSALILFSLFILRH
jgi:hypothetical protein